MGLKNFIGFELGASTSRILEINAASTPDSYMDVVGSVTTDPHDGDYCLKVSGDGSTQRYIRLNAIDNTDSGEDANLGCNTAYITFWFKVGSHLSTGEEMICRAFGTSMKCYLTLTHGGKIKMYGEADDLHQTGTTTIGTGAWYKIQWKVGKESAGGTGATNLEFTGFPRSRPAPATSEQIRQTMLTLEM